LGLDHLVNHYKTYGLDIVFRAGSAEKVLTELISETDANQVVWARTYLPPLNDRDIRIKVVLKQKGILAKSFPGHLLFEPWTVSPKSSEFFKVYTPFWKATRLKDPIGFETKVSKIIGVKEKLKSENLENWCLGKEMSLGSSIVSRYVRLGEDAARERLSDFISSKVMHYSTARDIPSLDGTSGLSENLSLGEISPIECWNAGFKALEEGHDAAEIFLKELVWREFAYHLAHHTPRILDNNWRQEWNNFPWNTNDKDEKVILWQQGRTGIPFVDAAMRELYVTGRMHNRGRMIVASFLTKHLMTHWKIGLKWFENCLIDWDPASNAMGWQWSAGSGPDATPYFRVFNPNTQLEKFDGKHEYRNRWLAEFSGKNSPKALSFFDAIPKKWKLTPEMEYPAPVVDLSQGRVAALYAYKNREF
jgi:deoxyribodipyrimidine photo-lyase